MTVSNTRQSRVSSHLFKSESVNSRRLSSIVSESIFRETELSKRAVQRMRKKEGRLGNATIDSIPEKGMFDWDGKQIVYLDGSGDGLPLHDVEGDTVLDARSAALIFTSETAKIVKDVCCLLPMVETRGIFTKKSYSFIAAMEKRTKKKVHGRGARRNPIGSDRYMIVGTRASRNARGLVDGLGLLKSSPMIHKEFSRILRNMEHRTNRWIDTLDLKFLAESKQRAGYPGFIYSGNDGQSKVWPSLACGKNIYLPLHTDEDYFLSAVAVCGERVADTVILQYFCFPTIGISVGLRHGDVLLFNPTVPHCISSPTSSRHNCFAVSAYIKSLVVSGNSNLL